MFWRRRPAVADPRWVVIARARDGVTLRTDERSVAIGSVGTILRMGPRFWGWSDASAELEDGTVIYALRRWSPWRGCEFVFDRVLPEGTQVILAGRAALDLPKAPRIHGEQWWERRDL